MPAEPGEGTGPVGCAGLGAGAAGAGARRVLGLTPQPATSRNSTASAARLEADPELRTERLGDAGRDGSDDERAAVQEHVVLEPVEGEEDAVRELSVEAVVGLVPHAGV